MNCSNCTITTPHLKSKCPYLKCKLCGKNGHLKRDCAENNDEIIEHHLDSENTDITDNTNTPKKLTRRQSSYIFICYTLARFNPNNLK